MPSFYQVLGISHDASNGEIKRAFRAKSLQHHTDKGGDQMVIKEINRANQILLNNRLRTIYDKNFTLGHAHALSLVVKEEACIDREKHHDTLREEEEEQQRELEQQRLEKKETKVTQELPRDLITSAQN